MENNNAPILLVMAAGMGSRYGGLKQMDKLTPKGDVMMDFSVFDALRAGFGKIVVLIKREIETDFEEIVGSRIRRRCDMQYAYQSTTDLPIGHKPTSREKPWGTGQAVWAARELVDRPFAVINADDFYGADAFKMMADFLKNHVRPQHYAMAGYELGSTLSESGAVTRGVCTVEGGLLTSMTECHNIVRSGDAATHSEDGKTWRRLELNTPVSMQIFGFHQSLMEHANSGFDSFLTEFGDDPNAEYLLPNLVGDLIRNKTVSMEVLPSPKRWFGVTYADDKPFVAAKLRELIEGGEYPAHLWQE